MQPQGGPRSALSNRYCPMRHRTHDYRTSEACAELNSKQKGAQ
jgi:hypothetical protein